MDKGQFFSNEDRYIHYSFEDVMFFWDHQARKVWMKFVGEDYDNEVPHDQRLFNDAILNGREISRAAYESGVPT